MSGMVLLVVWIVAVVLVWAAVAIAFFAVRPGRHWLIVPAAVPVAAIVIAGMLGPVATAPHPALALLAGLGLTLLGVVGGSPIVSVLLGVATRGSVPLGSHGGILVRDVRSPAPAQREILRGGTTIGYLERFALIGSVVAGQPGAVAVIVAVKGLGRYSELENELARERFIIGSLASLTWAGLCTAAIVMTVAGVS
ncbi:hypothetical protein GCM10027057_29790 [Marisediminicola antarctica]